MEGKYSGIKCVKASVNRTSDVSYIIKSKKKSSPFFIKIVAAFVILVAVFAVKSSDEPLAQEAFSLIQSVVSSSYEEVETEDYLFDQVIEYIKELSD